MILKELHTENKSVQTQLLFSTTQGKVISLQIAKGETLKEHVSNVPALLVCVSGNVIYTDEKESVISMSSGTYVLIEVNVKHAVKATEKSNLLLIK